MFNNIIGNPPYQDPQNARFPLWQKFFQKSIDQLVKDGHMINVHPGNWRKPDHKLLEVFKSVNLTYLNINSPSDGMKAFGCSTRYDWYYLNKCDYSGSTYIVDQDDVCGYYNILKMPFIPNGKIDLIMSLIAKPDEEKTEVIHSYSAYETRKPHVSKEKTEVLYSRSAYGSDKKHVSKEKTGGFIYPCIHATKSKDIVYCFSNTDKNGHFGIPKVILGLGNVKNPFIDTNGNFGMTQNCFGIVTEDMENISKCFKSKKFQILIPYLTWSGMALDFRVFLFIRKDFWKEFVCSQSK